ncbi:MAG: Diguanylate cyclase [Parcubacteria group bacterium GW2011_GWD2_38_11]|nr:MAG: Diguanylate cyclase [Parcubacteria group bacterium GW2011_GWD2_38_11]
MSKNKIKDVMIFKGGKGPNSWWISLDSWHRQLFRSITACGGVFAFDSIFMNILGMLQVSQLSIHQLRISMDVTVLAILFCGSVIYTNFIRKEARSEYKHKKLNEEFLTVKNAELNWENEKDLLLEKLYSIEELIMEDHLTGLLNRRGIVRTLKQYSAKAKRTKGEIHILFIDLDKLKDINSEFGHSNGGDRAIIEVARAIHETARREEPGCRFGGDEFLMIILYENTSPGNVRKTDYIKKRLEVGINNIHALAVPIENPAYGYKKIPISVTIATHILDLEKPIEEELNKASEQMLALKKK